MYSRILLPLDGSELGERAVPHAQALAKAFHASVHLVHVVSRAHLIETSRMGDMASVQTVEMAMEYGKRLVDAQLERGKTYLQHLAQILQRDGLVVHTTVLEGAAAEHIVKYAAEKDIHLIVMSTRGHGGPKRLFMGSVTDQVARSSDVPVLVIPPRAG